MFRRKQKTTKGVTPTCGYRDSGGVFFSSYEDAVKSNNLREMREKEERLFDELLKLLGADPRQYSSLEFQLRRLFRDKTFDLYKVLHKHYRKEGL